jgi:hypothetical protein
MRKRLAIDRHTQFPAVRKVRLAQFARPMLLCKEHLSWRPFGRSPVANPAPQRPHLPVLHNSKTYFEELLETRSALMPEGLPRLLRLGRNVIEILRTMNRQLVHVLETDSVLAERVARLMTIPGVGVILALTWALEIGDVARFASLKAAISYCGLCGAEQSSAGKPQRTPISKQRNKHLQTTLVEAAKVAPRWHPEYALLYDQEKQKGNRNRATLAIARKLVSYLLAIDRGQRVFLARAPRDIEAQPGAA